MKILQVHNYYTQRGGEDVVVETEARMLAEHGHDVRLFSVSNSSLGNPVEKIAAAFNVCYSESSRKKLLVAIKEFGADIVHFHNFFPRISPSGYDACREAGVPAVQTLHNFRLLCPGVYLMRNGKICEKCLPANPYRAIFHRCYRQSLSGTLLVAGMMDFHRRRRTWHERVDAFIAVTDFARSKFVSAGFPGKKIHVKTNPVPDRFHGIASEVKREGGLFVGRLSPEKGIENLLNAWRLKAFPLKIAGGGPLRDVVEKLRSSHLVPLGELSPEAVALEMVRAAFLIVPSVWYEGGSPLVVAEAFAAGLPVIASRLGSMAESVCDGRTGLHFTPGDPADLAAKIQWAIENPAVMAEMGNSAREEYEQKYRSEENYRQLMDIYNTCLVTGRNRISIAKAGGRKSSNLNRSSSRAEGQS